MEKERKVYEAPVLRVHQTMSAIKPLCGSGNDGTHEATEESRGLWLDDEE